MTPPANTSELPGISVSRAPTSPPVQDSATPIRAPRVRARVEHERGQVVVALAVDVAAGALAEQRDAAHRAAASASAAGRLQARQPEIHPVEPGQIGRA